MPRRQTRRPGGQQNTQAPRGITPGPGPQNAAVDELKKADKTQENLDTLMSDLDSKRSDLTEKREEIEKAVAGYQEDASGILASFNNAKVDIGSLLEKLVGKAADLVQREIAVQKRELQADKGFPEKIQEAMELLELSIKEFEETKKKKLADFVARESAILEKEQERNNGYADERAKLAAELSQKTREAEVKIATKQAEEEKNLDEYLTKIRDVQLKKVEAEMGQIRSDIEKHQTELIALIEENRKSKAQNDSIKEKLEDEKEQLVQRRERLDEKEQEIEKQVRMKFQNDLRRKDETIREREDEISKLHAEAETYAATLRTYDALEIRLADQSADEVKQQLDDKLTQIMNLKEELALRSKDDLGGILEKVRVENNGLKETRRTLLEENEKLREENAAKKKAEMERDEAESRVDSLETQIENYQETIDQQNRQLEVYRKKYAPADGGGIPQIEEPYFAAEVFPKGITFQGTDIDEIDWVENIRKKCDLHGFEFPERLVYAFHTALKTFEWSPMTVLAGVSGTGKSELPRLYSHFGGINFLSVPVQPNWDSPESMLGFYNSIENKFEAEPILRFLAQTQKESDQIYPYGLEDAVNIVLLDEMNLAHIELYFADFLSKLEQRRGEKESIPHIGIKLGTDRVTMENLSYPLRLGRNVLWVGTMNQDETTKSLSDKVLDRGIVIFFPRPSSLKSRQKLEPLGVPGELLPREVWENWWQKVSLFNAEQIKEYKEFIEKMNNALSGVGRALGHRVWQSIEYYMSNHPKVMAAHKSGNETDLNREMKLAFEDQLAQKVMPKLRGIETGSKAGATCIASIREQLDGYSIIDDFKQACDFGYGQFLWNSANYLDPPRKS